MARKDYYYNKAKQEDYRSRSAYKLKQIDDRADIISEGSAVLDLGAAPGGWLQVAVERGGRPVIGVDRLPIDPLEGVRTIRGDITAEETTAAIRTIVASEIPGTGELDVVLSDMAPNMTGEYSIDHARSVHLGRQAFSVATNLLRSGGNFVVKVFEGTDLEAFQADVAAAFGTVQIMRPDASRDESSEVYLVSKGRLTAPVQVGDVLTVEIEDVGDEGDGIAKIDGFTVFVPGGEPGETVEIEVADVKPQFGFAERLD